MINRISTGITGYRTRAFTVIVAEGFGACHRHPKVIVNNAGISVKEKAVEVGAVSSRGCGLQVFGGACKRHNRHLLCGRGGVYNIHSKVEVKGGAIGIYAIGDVGRNRPFYIGVLTVIVSITLGIVPHR